MYTGFTFYHKALVLNAHYFFWFCFMLKRAELFFYPHRCSLFPLVTLYLRQTARHNNFQLGARTDTVHLPLCNGRI